MSDPVLQFLLCHIAIFVRVNLLCYYTGEERRDGGRGEGGREREGGGREGGREEEGRGGGGREGVREVGRK